MPSIRFFQEGRKDGALQNAYRKLTSNIPLILQILTILGFAAAIANPYITQQETSGSTVLVLDNSASTSGDLKSLKQEAKTRLGEQNTLITANEDVNILAERVSRRRSNAIIDNIQPKSTETDIASAVQLARNYDGKLVIASDLDQTVDDRDASNLLDTRVQRQVTQISPNTGNKWGFTSIEPSFNKTRLEVTNFQQTGVSLELSSTQKSKTVNLSEGESSIVRFESKLGENTVSLPEDGMNSDNKAYFYIPDQEQIQISYIGKPSEHFRKAIELIQGMSLLDSYSKDADVYFLGSRLDNQTKINSIRSQVDQGDAAIIESASNTLNSVFRYDSAKTELNTSVTLTKPVATSLDQDIYTQWNVTGESLSNPSVVKRVNYGEGSILLNGVPSSVFRDDFLYPVFWKESIRSLVDRPSISELNIETGLNPESAGAARSSPGTYRETVNSSQTGFYEKSSKTYAVNLESAEESNIEKTKYSSGGVENAQMQEKSLQTYLIAALAVLMLLELAYIRHKGEM